MIVKEFAIIHIRICMRCWNAANVFTVGLHFCMFCVYSSMMSCMCLSGYLPCYLINIPSLNEIQNHKFDITTTCTLCIHPHPTVYTQIICTIYKHDDMFTPEAKSREDSFKNEI